jgi:preprotein translocase subunit SecF
VKPLNLISIKPNLNFVSKRVIFFGFSLLLILVSISMFIARDLNYGIDFQGGILVEVRVDKAGKLGEMRQRLTNLGLGEVSLQEFGAPTDILIRIQKQAGGEKAQQIAIDKVKRELGVGVKYRRTEFVGPKVSEELFQDGVIAVFLAIIGILLFVWFRFEWQFGWCYCSAVP